MSKPIRPSSWLQPGQQLCEGCSGSGSNSDGTDACPACRGFGSAPPDPASAPHPAGTVCRACGNPGTSDDPVVSLQRWHRSHAAEQTQAYREALAAMRRKPGRSR